MNSFEADNLRTLAEKWVQAARKHRAAEIDATMCCTQRDWDNLHKAEAEVETAQTAFNAALSSLTDDS